ncbi:DNA-binding transcriptional regulator Fis [bacterium]|jgi:Fis family transcriptional regulator|nr:DNA-binding transcriptional regulator Fis [bacterium]MDB2649924.1 DNA-binding transcriptional regulator Fis [Porticoccaceae bacterium]
MISENDNQTIADDLTDELPVITEQKSLRDHVSEAMKRYFEDLDGQDTKELYDIVMAEVEPPLLEAAMKYTRQNQSKTAALLGLNRGTLRKKLKQYNLL